MLGDFLSHFSVGGNLVPRRVLLVLSVPTLLKSCQRLIVALGPIVANLHLVHVGGPLFIHSVLHSVRAGQLVRRISGFKLVALLKAHLEVVLALGGHLMVHGRLVVDVLGRLGHAALVLAQVVQFVRSKGEIGLGASIPLKYLVRVLFALLDRLDVFFPVLALGAEALLGGAFGHLEVLGWQVGPAQLVDQL